VSKLGRPYDPKTGRGVIGKNYCYQVGSMGATGYFENKEFNLFMGAGALGVSLDDYNGDYFDHSDLDFLHGGMISMTQTGRRPIANNGVPPGTPNWGKEFKAASIKYFNRSLSIGCQGASLPWRHHYLDLDPTYKDAWGQPLVRITFDFEDQDRNMVKYIAQKTAEIMKEMGADTVVAGGNLGPYNIVPYQSTHNTGGAIMGGDPATSAVNNYSQMWDAENVFVLGAATFAHNGGANPTGTVGALAYRAAEGVIKYSKSPGILV
jgi:gluconate 2-dehydrogenase alpha chain